jgi:hypothetical protein
MDDIIGKVLESIYVNVNDEYRLSYNPPEGRNKSKKFEQAKLTIDDFNEEVNANGIIREKTTKTYGEGNVVLYLRGNKTDGWCIDEYPLGIAIISPYMVDGEPIVLIDINELKNRLFKDGYKQRNGKDMFFATVEDAIKANYAPEVFDAFKAKEPYAKLDVSRSHVVRIGNFGGRYGLTPIFRALAPSIVLQNFYRSDEINSKARSKKVLLQILRESATSNVPNAGLDITGMAYANQEILRAYKQPGSVVYTAPNVVSDVKYVEPRGDLIEPKNFAFHLNRIMSTLGIGFLSMESANQSVSTAKLSLEQLMKTINAITRQFERAFKKFYMVVLQEEGFDPSYAPTMKILDSEYLEFSLRKELAQMLYTMFNGSLRTSLDLVGIDLDDELDKRRKEQEDGVDKIFTPRLTAFTNNGKQPGEDAPDNGRPKGEENDKQGYDDEYNKTREGST